MKVELSATELSQISTLMAHAMKSLEELLDYPNDAEAQLLVQNGDRIRERLNQYIRYGVRKVDS